MTHTHSTNPVTECSGGKKKALLIAVQNNTIKGFPKLYHAQRDAMELRRLLIEVFGYPDEDVVLMMDDKSVRKTLWPTKTRIRKQIQLLVQGASAGDRLFFYYSGHGRQVPCRHHSESDGLDEEIYTCNGKEIMDNDLKKWLVEPLPHGCKLFALWDSCHSQTMLDLEHNTCNEPGSEQCTGGHRNPGSQSAFRRALPKRFRRSSTLASQELRGRPVARASVSITAVSPVSSPSSSKWIPFSVGGIQRVLSPPPWSRCNGECSVASGSDAECAHVISLSACKDNESAFDDDRKTVTRFFIDHLKEKPKSTLRELLLVIRQQVDEITAARQACEKETRVISRRSTFTSGRRIKTEWTPQVIRRKTEINVDTLEELSQYTSITQEEQESKYSQKPSYSSRHRLNLDDPVDI